MMTNDEKEYFARMKRMPPKNIDTVFGQPRGVKIESDSWVVLSLTRPCKLEIDQKTHIIKYSVKNSMIIFTSPVVTTLNTVTSM